MGSPCTTLKSLVVNCYKQFRADAARPKIRSPLEGRASGPRLAGGNGNTSRNMFTRQKISESKCSVINGYFVSYCHRSSINKARTKNMCQTASAGVHILNPIGWQMQQILLVKCQKSSAVSLHPELSTLLDVEGQQWHHLARMHRVSFCRPQLPSMRCT